MLNLALEELDFFGGELEEAIDAVVDLGFDSRPPTPSGPDAKTTPFSPIELCRMEGLTPHLSLTE